MADCETSNKDEKIKLYIREGQECLNRGDISDAVCLFRSGLEEIDKQYQSNILRFCQYRLFSYRDYAEDATQETFIAAFKQAEVFDVNASVRSWLYRIAHNKCIDILRRIRHEKFVPIYQDDSVYPEAFSDLPNVPDSSHVFPSIDTWLDCERIYHMLITVLPTNGAGQRRRSILRYVVEEKSQKDIAQILQISNSLVTKDLQYIRKLIVAIETAFQQFAANLSDDQRQLLRLVIQGKRLNEIAGLLGISLHRVKQELQEIRRLLYAILEGPGDHGGGGQGKTREARSLGRHTAGVRPGHQQVERPVSAHS